MIISFSIDGKKVFDGEADVVPPAGGAVVFRMKVAHAGLREGCLVTAKVSQDQPPSYDYDTLAPHVWVNLAVIEVTEALE